jgi:CubicO group peptidase (beta-lactamase class C family)
MRQSVTVRSLLVAVLALSLALPAVASARPLVPPGQVKSLIAKVVGAAERAGVDLEEPVFAAPAPADLATGRAKVMMDPAFWFNAVHELAGNGAAWFPKPIDAVRPEMYLPLAPVAAGGDEFPLPSAPQELLDVTYQWNGRTKTLGEFLHTTETDAVLFVQDGAIVAEHYANGWSGDVRHQPWSVTKSFVSALIGIALGEGRIASLDEPIEDYIGELGGTAWEGVTIENLLQMESGVHWDEGTPVLAQNTQVQQWVELALDYHSDGAAGMTRNEFLKSLPKTYEQGTRFSYNSGNTQVLAWLLETVYGKPLNAVISEKLWVPMGMAGDAMVMTDRLGDAVASQGLYARSHDFARFGELFRLGGRTPGGDQVVPAAWVTQSTTMSDVSGGQYAYQWWIGARPGGYTASGFEGQKITVQPDACLTGVRLAHQLGGDFREGDDPTDPSAYRFAVEMGGEEWFAVYRAVADHLGGCA